MRYDDEVDRVRIVQFAGVADDRLQLRRESPQLQVLKGGGDRREIVTEARDGVDRELSRLQGLLSRLQAHDVVKDTPINT